MKRFLSISFITLTLVISAAGAAPAAHAQFDSSTSQEDALSRNEPTAAEQQVAVVPVDPAAANTANTLPPNPDLGEGFGKVMTWIMSLFAWLVGVASLTLDYAVFYTVVKMGDYVNNLSAVGVTWQIMRDIGNIVIIFGFLAIGISTILNTERIGYGKKMLPMLLVAAVFLNFSLFLAEAVIDTGNLFATQFYTQIKGGVLPTSASLSQTTIENEGISNKIMTQLGLQTVYGKAIDPERATKLLKAGNTWIIGFMGIILFLITAFVMFSLAFILIARFIILLFLIIVAPIGFAGLAVPKLENTAKKWWSALFEQTITAPVLLLLLYIALRVITDVNFLTGFGSKPDWTGFVENGDLTGFAGLVLSFLVAMGLLMAVVIISKKMSAFGGASVMKFAGSVQSGATKFAMGSVKFAGRSAAGVGRWGVNRTAGRVAHMASQGLMRTGIGQTQLGRLAATGLAKGGKGFKEAKEKSAKTHEEYRSNVAKALEEAHAPAIADARLKREKASTASEDTIKTATAERDTATKEAQPLVNEVKRLEGIIKSKGKFDPERIAAEKDLVAAKERAAPAEVKVIAAEDKLKTASAPLDAAQAEEEAATKALAKAKREAAVAYGESARTAFTENPLTWVISGPGGSAAGNKIIQDTLKKMSESEEAWDKIKKVIEKEAKAAEKSAETSEALNKAKEDLKEKTEKETEAKP